MRILNSQSLKIESTLRRWEGNDGRYLLDTYARVKTDQGIFGHVTENKGRRLVREGELRDALVAEFAHVGGHPFEVCEVKSETEFTVKFRSGYSSGPVALQEDDLEDENDD